MLSSSAKAAANNIFQSQAESQKATVFEGNILYSKVEQNNFSIQSEDPKTHSKIDCLGSLSIDFRRLRRFLLQLLLAGSIGISFRRATEQFLIFLCFGGGMSLLFELGKTSG